MGCERRLTLSISLGPNIVRVLPSTCVTFLVYENMKFYLPRMWDSDEDRIAALGVEE